MRGPAQHHHGLDPFIASLEGVNRLVYRNPDIAEELIFVFPVFFAQSLKLTYICYKFEYDYIDEPFSFNMSCFCQRGFRWRNLTLVTLALGVLTGCAIKRDAYHVPQIVLPERFLKAATVFDALHTPDDTQRSVVVSKPLNAMLGEWWLLLGNPELNALMNRVLANNPDLRVATLRIAQLQARMDVTRSGGLPEINIPVQLKNEAPANGVGSAKAGQSLTSQKTYQASLRGDWRPDLWGEFAAQFEAAQLQLWRSTFQRDDVQRTVVANVISTYVEYLSLNDRLRVARDTELTVSEMLGSVATRVAAGDATAIDYEQQKAAVFQVRATIPVLQQQRELVFNRLASLAGTMPHHLQLSDKGLDSISFPSVMPGVPSALLLRRPDVRAVEAQLLAADADIDTARARILPPLDLTAQIGYGSQHLADLFQPHNLAWNFIANLSMNLFDGGKRSKEIEFSRAVHEELVETYVRVIYEAAREVDDSLTTIKMMDSRLRLQRISADASLQAWTYSQEAYRSGAVDYLVVLDSERTYSRNLDDWIGARLQHYRGLSSMFSALGGGVAQGIMLPGYGNRPLALKSEVDYGGVKVTSLSQSDPSASVGLAPENSSDMAHTVLNFSPAGQQENDSLLLSMSAALQVRAPVESIDWPEEIWREPGDHWLVEVSGLYERSAILPAWRDLLERFPTQVKERTLVPHRLGLITQADMERASWYRIYIARNPSNEAAQKLCADLQARLQRCRVMLVRQPSERASENQTPVFTEVKPEVATIASEVKHAP